MYLVPMNFKSILLGLVAFAAVGLTLAKPPDKKLPPHLGLAQGYTAIPFVKAGNLILLQGQIGEEKGSFILDTGAPYLVLNSTYFGGKSYNSAKASGVTGGKFSAGKKNAGPLSLGTLRWDRLKADVAPLGNVENAKGVKILGLLGVSLFEDYELVINYYINQIYLCPVDKNGVKKREAKLTGFRKVGGMSMKVTNHILFASVEIDGRKLRGSIDTGAESCVLDSRLPNRIIKHVTISRRFVMQGVGGGQVEVLSGLLDNLTCEEKDFENLQVVITSLEQMSQAYGSDIDIMLGYTWLSRHVVSFNFRKGEIGFWEFEE